MAQAKVGSLAEARSHNVPPDVFLKHYRTIRDCKKAHADTGTAVARAKKSAKGDGIDLDALKTLEKLADLGTDEAEMQIRHLQIYAGWLKLPIGMQLAMFGEPEAATVDAKTAAEQREWEARDMGSSFGRAGHERGTNPNLVGSAEHAAYDRGWLEGHKIWLKGQKKIANEMAPKKAANGARTNGRTAPAARKRGRPSKASGEQANIL
jgi:hypothetical protein